MTNIVNHPWDCGSDRIGSDKKMYHGKKKSKSLIPTLSYVNIRDFF